MRSESKHMRLETLHQQQQHHQPQQPSSNSRVFNVKLAQVKSALETVCAMPSAAFGMMHVVGLAALT